MKFLEILGLDALLEKTGSATGIVGGFLVFIGMMAWVFLGIVAGPYMDKSAVAWNLLPAILLLIFHVIRTILSLTKNKDDNVILNIIFMIIMIACFIVGLHHPYHALIFHYEYKPLWSAIAYTLYPNIIRLLIDGISLEKTFFDKISLIPKAIGVYILVFLVILFIGQAFSTIFWFTGKTDIYDGFANYHQTAYNKARAEYNDKTLEEFLNEKYKKVDEHYKRICSEQYSDLDGERFDKQCKATQEGINGSMYIESMNNVTRKEYGYYVTEHFNINNEYKDVIKVIDKEWNTYTYYILDRSNYSVKETTKDYYNEVKNQNNK